jgi:hypothetical protein
MAINEFEYYLIERKGDKAYPLVTADEDSEHTELYIGDNFSKYRGKPIPKPKKTEFVFCDPIPRKPVIGDYFSEPESIVSKKIADAMKAMNIKGIQLIPATVESNKGDVYEDFFFVYIHHYIEAMDKEKSDFELDEYDDEDKIYTIDSFRLDETVLKSIPLEERLIFKLKESGSKKLYHRSVVDVIMATNPEGVQFTKVEDWRL